MMHKSSHVPETPTYVDYAKEQVVTYYNHVFHPEFKM